MTARRRRRRKLAKFLKIGGLLAIAGTVIGFGGRWSWVLDHASHFRIQYFLYLSVGSLAAFTFRRYRLATIYLAFAVVNAAVIVPLYLVDPATPAVRGPRMRAMAINVLTTNNNYDMVTTYIEEMDPDVVLLSEITPLWMNSLETMKETYPHMAADPKPGYSGIALLSKHPFTHSEIIHMGSGRRPSILARIDVEGHPLTIFGTHPPRAGMGPRTRRRDRQLLRIADYLDDTGGAKMIIGDLNTTPWAHGFQDLLRTTGLQDTAKGYGFQPTWPAFVFPLQIPIDHCLVSEDLRTLDRKVGGFVGSDHYPLIVDLEFAG